MKSLGSKKLRENFLGGKFMKNNLKNMLKDPGFALVALGFMMAMFGVIYQNQPVSAGENTTKSYIVVRTNETTTTARTEVKTISNSDLITMDDAVLIAKLVLAEAEGEPEMGKRLVIDTVLNRLDSIDFPNTVYDVIHQPYHYSPAWDGRIEIFSELEDAFKLVVDEIQNRTNSEVLYFRTDYFHEFGTPMEQVGNHYFSTK